MYAAATASFFINVKETVMEAYLVIQGARRQSAAIKRKTRS